MAEWKCLQCGATKDVTNGYCKKCGPTQTNPVDTEARKEAKVETVEPKEVKLEE